MDIEEKPKVSEESEETSLEEYSFLQEVKIGRAHV